MRRKKLDLKLSVNLFLAIGLLVIICKPTYVVAAWSSVGTGLDGPCSAMAVSSGGNLYVGGSFSKAGGVYANNIAVWDGSAWSAIGAGVIGSVNALALAPDGTLYVGGKFNKAGDVIANNIAKWNGSAWSSLGTGVIGEINALALAPDGTLYAGGTFNKAGGKTAGSIARWNGSKWLPLGAGLVGNNDDPPDPVVSALAISPDGTLYVSGAFRKAGGRNIKYIAKWNGSSWATVGNGISGYKTASIEALAVNRKGTLYAGGKFEFARVKQTSNVATWNGATWSALGKDPYLMAKGVVVALALSRNGNLYLATHNNDVFVWDGSAITNLEAKVEDSVNALAVGPDDSLYVGGSFTRAGGKYVYSGFGNINTVKGGHPEKHIMRWND
jgi:hypothetical protein